MSDTPQTIAQRALGATSLLRQWDAVEDYVEACREQGVDVEHGGLDLSDLPTFGGERPAGLPAGGVLSVLSWDETHLLIEPRNGERRFVVVPRSAYVDAA